MPSVYVEFGVESQRAGTAHFEVASRRIVCDQPVGVLSAYAINAQNCTLLQDLHRLRPDGERQTLYDGAGWVAEQWRQVTCQRSQSGYRLQIEGSGQFDIAASGDRAAYSAGTERPEATVLHQAIVGPALILALALQGTWVLHASAVEFDGGVVLFLGDSGSGKSTLAGYLARQGDSIGQLVSDDLLPVEMDGDTIHVLPRFPQLILSLDEQPGPHLPAKMPLTAVYVVEPVMDRVVPPSSQSLATSDASLHAVRHTVASRLFDRRLLQEHMDICSKMARSVPFRRLVYPHRHKILPMIRDTIAADMGSLTG